MYTSPSGKLYIGQTVNEKNRRKLWKSSSYHYAGEKIDRARAKYGAENFKYKRLYSHYFNTKEDAVNVLNILEPFYIALYHTVENGYNCDVGGLSHYSYTGSKNHYGGYKLKDITKKRIAKASKQRWKSSAYRKRWSKASKGKRIYKKGYRNISKSKSIVQLSLTGDFLNEYQSQRVAESEILGKDYEGRTNIGPVCNGKRDTALGYKWLFKDDYYNYFLHPEKSDIPLRVKRALEDIKKRTTPKIIPIKTKKERRKSRSTAQKVGQYGDDLHLIKVWNSADEAAYYLKINVSNIDRAKKTLGKYKGFYWRNYNGEETIKLKEKKIREVPWTYKPVLQKDLNNNIINTFKSITEACKYLGVKNKVLLSRCLNHKVDKAYGYKWEFLKTA